MADNNVPRRDFLKGGAGRAAAAATVMAGGLAACSEETKTAAAPTAAPEPMLTLTATEAAFLAACYDTIIPADALSPSGSDCGLVTYIDRQLAGAWGNGARMYRSGPFIQTKPEYGYQLPLSPREYFGAGIAAANAWSTKTYGKEFDRLEPAMRAEALTQMEQGRAAFASLDAKLFFEAVLQSAMEGFFADPIYGGNRNKASWRMVGYPGLPATWAAKAEEYRGKKVSIEPQSIADFS